MTQTHQSPLRPLIRLLYASSTLLLSSCQTTPPHSSLKEVTKKNLPHVSVRLAYATTDNITKKALYSSPKAYLRPETIKKLQNASLKLKKKGYRLVLLDAWRTESAQQALWQAHPNPKYLVPPHLISRHRRGTSVDITLASPNGETLEMPSTFDSFCSKADWILTDIPQAAAKHAIDLKEAMLTSGFSTVPDEWWHYDLKNWKDFEPIPEGPKTQ